MLLDNLPLKAIDVLKINSIDSEALAIAQSIAFDTILEISSKTFAQMTFQNVKFTEKSTDLGVITLQ